MGAMADNIAGPLKLWMRKIGWTQEEVAARLGISRDRYAKWEEGKANPRGTLREALYDMGFRTADNVAERRAVYGETASPDLLSLLIDTIYDCEVDPDRRAAARRELYRALRLAD